MTLYTTTVSVGEHQFGQFQFLHLKQSMKEHHEFELGIGYDWLSNHGPNPLIAGKSFLGKEINICIQAIEPTLNFKPLLFNGIITSVSSGKEKNGTTGSCTLRGNSPTILLSGNPHMQSYEQLALSSIVNTVFKNCYPLTVNLQVNPALTYPLKYIVQYKETGFEFLQRLSQRYGEHFFYNGQQIIFGQYIPQKTSLTHQADLIDFQLECKILPGNQLLHAYEYRLQQVIEEETGSHVFSTLNNYSQQVHSLSNKCYHHAASYKIPYAFSSNARAELSTLAQQYQKARISQMVFIRGSSRNTGLRPGNIISIQERWHSREDHGEFILTKLEHHCDGNGDYYNTFEGIPSDVATPQMHLTNAPQCEAQSAVVTDNHDPKGLGRIRVKFNWQNGATPWIRLHQPHGGANKGFYFIPEINEEVWVDFEGGNPEAPFATGCASNGNARTNYGDEMNNIKVIKTRSGHTIRMDDTHEQENIIISDKGGNTIIMDTHGQNISLSAPESIKITAKNISIHTTENIDMHAGLHMNHTAGMNIIHSAGDCLSQYTVNDYQLTATNITKTAMENIHLQAKEIEKNAEEINIESSKENMQISAEKTVHIKSGEKSKIF
ncbi:type VI secretion system Vgr family protein [Chitinophaga sp. RAB17]|uniref:type VI secretion system Vgr family protein n=1 Tax=Chitinophaga sp. RAB17 TaxID=3233049 RepID=UPI003F917BA3